MRLVAALAALLLLFVVSSDVESGDAERWTSPSGFNTDINVGDYTALIAGSTAYPPMLGGAQAYGGPDCPYPP